MNYAQNIDWTKTWKLIYETTKEVKLRIFQFKVMHRILATNLFLMNNKIKDNANCQHCNLEETVEHLFWECNYARHFWNIFQNFYQHRTNQTIVLTCPNIIFGVFPQNRKKYSFIING